KKAMRWVFKEGSSAAGRERPLAPPLAGRGFYPGARALSAAIPSAILTYGNALCVIASHPWSGMRDGEYRQAQAEPLFSGGDAPRDPGGGPPAGPLPLLDHAARVEAGPRRDPPHALPHRPRLRAQPPRREGREG